MKDVRLISRRQADGTYRVWASDGAQHHLLGTVQREETRGPHQGLLIRWRPIPAGALQVEAKETPRTLGTARRQLLEAWTRGQRSQASRHGLPGCFIVVEGGDGAGKTSLVQALARELTRRGVPASVTEEPSRGPMGRLLREALAGRGALVEGPPMSPQEWALLYAADRAHHLRAGVLPALARGEVVVCSRYTLSSLAYQGPALGLEWVATVNAHAPAPDVLLYLDVPAEVGVARVESGRTPDAFENGARAREAAAGYARGLAHLEAQGVRTVRVDASQPPEAVLRAALAVVLPLLPQPAQAVGG